MTTTQQPSLWNRIINWLTEFDEILHFDSARYNFGRVDALQQEVTKLKSRIEELETELDQPSDDRNTREAA